MTSNDFARSATAPRISYHLSEIKNRKLQSMKDPRKNRNIRLRLAMLSIVSLVALCAVTSSDRAAGAQTKRPMAFMDIMEMRQATAPTVAPDGKWAVYTLSAPDWKAAKS